MARTVASPLHDNPFFTTEFIHMYRGFPCLWRRNSEDYFDRCKRDEALSRLLELCRIHHPEADVKFVLQKIQTLRNGYRRELKREREWDAYVPNLWYFPHMEFIKEDYYERQMERLRKSTSSNDTCTDSDTDAEETGPSNNEEAPNPGIPGSRKRKTDDETNSSFRKELLKRVHALMSKENNEYSAWAVWAAAKLRRMRPDQLVICEKMITDVIHMGLRGQLTSSTVGLLETSQYLSRFQTEDSSSTPASAFLPAPSTSHQAPSTSYQAPAPSHQGQSTSYQAPAPSHQGPSTSYQATAPSHQAPITSYQEPNTPWRAPSHGSVIPPNP